MIFLLKFSYFYFFFAVSHQKKTQYWGFYYFFGVILQKKVKTGEYQQKKHNLTRGPPQTMYKVIKNKYNIKIVQVPERPFCKRQSYFRAQKSFLVGVETLSN